LRLRNLWTWGPSQKTLLPRLIGPDHHRCRNPPHFATQWLALLLRIREVPSSHLSSEIGYTDWGFSRYFFNPSRQVLDKRSHTTHLWKRRGVSGQVTPRPRFSPGERTPGTHWTGGWVGPRAALDTEVREKIPYLCRGSNLDRSVVQSVATHYTDLATFIYDTANPFHIVSKLSDSCGR
jgi:hypothetical protein